MLRKDGLSVSVESELPIF